MNSLIQGFLSLFLIVNLYLMGNKSIWGPITGVALQIVWVFYTIATHQYGLIPGAAILAIIHVRNWAKWRKEDRGVPVDRVAGCSCNHG
jgi:hypothetical protein